jgi:hypothetical protein
MLTLKNNISSIGKRRFGLVPLIVLSGLCATFLMYWITDLGPGVGPDSIVYIETAQSLLAGNGFFVKGQAMTSYPPVYPLLLGLVGLLYHGNILLAARLLAALLFGANIVLLGLAVRLCTRHSLVGTGCAMLIFLSSAPAISIHSMAMSEALYITFSMASFLLLAYHIVRPTPSLLLLASLMAGLAIVTRYVGVVLFPSMALALLLLGNRSIKHKMRDTLVFAGVVSLPIASWLIRNILVTKSVANREFAFHPVSLNHVHDLIITMHDFALPISISPWTKAIHVGVAISFFLFGIALLHKRMYIKQNATQVGIVLPTLCLLYFFMYVVFLFISISCFDAATPFDERILLPAFLTLIVVAFALTWSLSDALKRQCFCCFFVLLALFSVSVKTNHAISSAVDIHNNGTEFTSRDWQHSEIITFLKENRDVRKIYSNGPDVISFLTGMEVAWIPAEESTTSHRLNTNYEEQLNRMLRECREGEALVVYLTKITWRWYLPSIDKIESRGNVPVLRKMHDGVIYGTWFESKKSEALSRTVISLRSFPAKEL